MISTVACLRHRFPEYSRRSKGRCVCNILQIANIQHQSAYQHSRNTIEYTSLVSAQITNKENLLRVRNSDDFAYPSFHLVNIA